MEHVLDHLAFEVIDFLSYFLCSLGNVEREVSSLYLDDQNVEFGKFVGGQRP